MMNKLKVLPLAITMIFLNFKAVATLIDGTDAFFGNGLARFDALNTTVSNSGKWLEDEIYIEGISIRNYNGDNPLIWGNNSTFGPHCANQYQPCVMTETDFTLTESNNRATGEGWVQGFAISRADKNSFAFDSAILLPNGFDPHIPGYDYNEAFIFIGEWFDITKPLHESMDIYSLGAIYDPRVMRTLDFGNTYSDVEQLFIFTSTDSFWDGINVSNARPISTKVPEPRTFGLFLLTIALLYIRNKENLNRCKLHITRVFKSDS